ncbi:MAG: YfhO family protein [Anaerolineae bacterium]
MELPKPWRYVLGAAVCAVVLACFAPVLWQGHVFYSGDMARLYIPAQAALQRSLRDGRLPWWSSELGIGYPLVAEGEVAALYPFTLVFSLWLSPELAITAQVLLHYALMFLGVYLYGRQLGMSPLPAALTGLIWAFGGFNLAHLSHVSILRAATWLPWLLWLMGGLSTGLPTAKALLRGGALALVVALQWLAGHPQMALLNSLVALAYALWLAARTSRRREAVTRLAMLVAAAGLGLVLALPQILPSVELVLQSQRAGGLDPSFFVSYSYSPLLTATWVSPFVLGNPYPDGSVELMFYVGLVPLALAFIGVLRSRRPERWWLAGLGLIGWLMSWGRWNPLYTWLHHVPVLNLFRVPARYLSWTGWALACLAGIGAQAASRTQASGNHARTGWYGLAASLGLTIAVLTWAATWKDLEQALAAWRWLPLLLAGAILSTMLTRCALGRRSWLLLLMLTIVVDLYAYQRVLLWTYSETAPRCAVNTTPVALETIESLEGRVYVKDEIVPARSVQEASLYPNLGLKHGVPVLNLYLPLVPSSYADWLEAMDPRAFNLAAGSGYIIPQLLPVDSASELYDMHNELSALPYDTWIDLEPTRISSMPLG